MLDVEVRKDAHPRAHQRPVMDGRSIRMDHPDAEWEHEQDETSSRSNASRCPENNASVLTVTEEDTLTCPTVVPLHTGLMRTPVGACEAGFLVEGLTKGD